MATAPTTIAELTLDPKNARKRGPRAEGLLVSSLHEIGAARSIVIDEAGRILAGNGTVQAAAEAGIEKVRVVDADGETIIAVRRMGLTEQQKRRLALLDNRTGELAEWDAEMLAALAQDGLELGDLWAQDELDALLAVTQAPDWGEAVDGLGEGDKAPFQQMTFTVSDAQAEVVGRAISIAKGAGPFTDTGNENSNGNALARICEAYRGHDGSR